MCGFGMGCFVHTVWFLFDSVFKIKKYLKQSLLTGKIFADYYKFYSNSCYKSNRVLNFVFSLKNSKPANLQVIVFY